MAREKTLPGQQMMKIVKHASLLVLQLIADPAADIKRLIRENWRSWNKQDRRIYGSWFSESEFAFLQTWIRQEITRIEAREASDAQAHPPPDTGHGGRDET